MKRQKVELPSIRDDESGFDYLLRLTAAVIADPYCYFDFNFKKVSVLDQNAVAVLGGLARYVDAHNSLANKGLGDLILSKAGVMFEVDSMSPLIRNQLIKNNFLSHFSAANFDGYPQGDYIGYREHTKHLDANEIALHLRDEWLSDEKLRVSPSLKNAIISKIFEIFMNAYGHGTDQSKLDGLGVISCGQYRKNDKKIKLTVLDFGPGIIENVRNHLERNISDVDSMKWALEMGHSTRTDSLNADIPRGLGFGLLQEFVKVNEGSLKIFSNNCCAYVDKKGLFVVEELRNSFSGTLVNVSINCDDRHYRFASDEAGSEQYF